MGKNKGLETFFDNFKYLVVNHDTLTGLSVMLVIMAIEKNFLNDLRKQIEAYRYVLNYGSLTLEGRRIISARIVCLQGLLVV